MPTGYYPRPSALERFEAKYTPEPNTGCWLWFGATCGIDYGYLRHDGRSQNAHRVSYQLFVGPIPAGQDIDHRCRVKCCVNPEHLEAVTRKENLLRAWETAVNTANTKARR